ncbi:T9SS type A sorting domain-containing protein [Hymenobacter gummosus]|uniref:T9SS type A sorting domain-containing protein n=1 Tax=Hymenobacter gummosus TaxID=1776032 RepID=UPI0014047AE6|nr:T9SS type A sorting domain-containing protein [Hymenobacter gummosus]
MRIVKLRYPAGSWDFPSDAVLEPDGHVTVVGLHAALVPGTSRYDYTTFLTQLDTLGNVRWRQEYTHNDVADTGRMLRLPDGYLLTSTSQPAPGGPVPTPVARLLRTDHLGALRWQRLYPSRGYLGIGHFAGLASCADGGYVAAGFCDQPDPNNPNTSAFDRASRYVVRLRPDGDTLQTAVLGTLIQREEATDVVQTPDGGYALAGLRWGPQGRTPFAGQVLKLDAQLRPQWTQTLVPGSVGCHLGPIRALASGEVVAAGFWWPSTGPGSEGVLARFSASGGLLWTVARPFGFYDTRYMALLLRADGSALLSGFTQLGNGNRNQYDGYFARYAGVGAPYQPDPCAAPPAPEFTWSTPAPDSLVVLDISLPGPQYAVGALWRWDFGDGSPAQEGRALARHRYAQPPAAATPVTLAYTNSLGCTRSVTLYPFRPAPLRPSAALAATLRLFPNPAGGARRVTVLARAGAGGPATLRLLDPVGRLVRTVAARPAPDGALRQELELSGLPAGLYLVQLVTEQGTAARRLLLE